MTLKPPSSNYTSLCTPTGLPILHCQCPEVMAGTGVVVYFPPFAIGELFEDCMDLRSHPCAMFNCGGRDAKVPMNSDIMGDNKDNHLGY